MNGTLPGWGGGEETHRQTSFKADVQTAFEPNHLAIGPVLVANSLAHRLKGFVATLFPARTGSVPMYRASYSKK